MTACSRCGTTTGQHTMECLQAMALGWAMGVEERPKLGPVRVETEPFVDDLRLTIDQLRAELARVETQNNEQAETIGALRAEVDRLTGRALAETNGRGWPAVVQELRGWLAVRDATIASLRAEVGRWEEQFAHLYDEDVAARHAEIQAEIESPAFQQELADMAASPDLEVEVHDEANATVRPKQDEDAAADRAWDEVEQVTEAFDTDETPPAPEPAPLPPEAAPAAQAPEPEAPKPARTYGGLGDPEWVHPDAPAFIADNIEPSDNPADYVTTARISSTLAAWNTRTGKNLGPTPAYREIARRFMRGKPIHDGKQVDGYYGMKLSGTADGTMSFVPDAAFDAAPPRGAGDERLGVKGAWKSPESRYIDACVTEFLDGNLIVTQDLNDWLAGPDLRAAYDEWAHANGKPDSDAYPGVDKVIGGFASKRALVKRQRPYSAERPDYKPVHFRGVRLGTVPVEKKEAAPEPQPQPEKPKITPADLDPRERNKRDVEELRSLMKASASRVEEIPTASVTPPPGPDELAMKLAQLKHFGIGGVEGVSKDAARSAVADLHPTGREVWTSVPGESWSDSDLEASAYQLLVKCMDGLPEEIGFDYKDDVLATAGFVEEDVIAAVRNPQRVEIRPESWDKEKRYPILGFTKGDVQVIMGMRTPTKPRVIAAYWTSLLQADSYRVDRHGGGGRKKSTGLPTNPGTSMSRLKTMGCEIEGDPLKDKAVKVTYRGQDLGKITCGAAVPKLTVQSDYQRTLRKMQAIDRREEAKVG
jgi:hypothetical protein